MILWDFHRDCSVLQLQGNDWGLGVHCSKATIKLLLYLVAIVFHFWCDVICYSESVFSIHVLCGVTFIQTLHITVGKPHTVGVNLLVVSKVSICSFHKPTHGITAALCPSVRTYLSFYKWGRIMIKSYNSGQVIYSRIWLYVLCPKLQTVTVRDQNMLRKVALTCTE